MNPISGRRPRACTSLDVYSSFSLVLKNVALMIPTVIAYQMSLTFWTAAFPSLARNTLELRAKAEEYNVGSISRAEYDYADTIQRSRLSNMAFYIQSLGEIVILAVIVGVLFGVNVNVSQENNNWGLSVLIAFATGVSVHQNILLLVV